MQNNTSNTDQIQQKKERLRNLRKQAQERRENNKRVREQFETQFGGDVAPSININNDLITRILAGEDPHELGSASEEYAQLRREQARQQQELKISTFIVDMEILPKEKHITYDRQVQCDLIDSSMVKHLEQIKEEQEHDEEGQRNLADMGTDPLNSSLADRSPDPLRKKKGMGVGKGCSTCGSLIFEEAPPVLETAEEKAKREKKELMESFQLMTKEDSQVEMQSRGFDEFMSRTSRIIERALDQEFDAIGDFFEESDEEGAEAKKQKGDKLTQQFTFQHKQPLKRAVTSMDWSPKEAELILVSYSKCSEFRYDQPDGLVHVYSMSLKNRPEFTLTCQSEVTKAMFHPHLPNIVIGATYSGYVVQWDIRLKSTPIQKSIVAKDGHSHPINSLAVVGTKNAHNIVSMSNDSKICQWHFGELNNPKINFNMFNQTAGSMSIKSDEQTLVQVNTMEFPEEQSDKFYVGVRWRADYNIYQANMHMSDSKEQQDWHVFQGHQAPVTKISLHPGKSMTEGKNNGRNMTADMSELMLSASQDWTVKLWYAKNGEKRTPIHTFESSQEYVYDVQWSPVHPSVFAQVDGDGYVDIWDINKDTEFPIVHKKGFEQSYSGAHRGDFDETKALSCLKWSRDGRRIAIGDSNGFVTIWHTDKELHMPQQTDFDKIEELIQGTSTENEI